VRAAAPALKERLPRLGKAADLLRYLHEEPPPPQLDETQLQMIRAAAERLQDVDWTPAAIESALEEIREAHGWSRGKFFNPLRAAIAGRDTPPIHDTLALLPKQEALARMRRVLPWS
jgi:glutamyl/glutaminyl-tRNA synthetase